MLSRPSSDNRVCIAIDFKTLSVSPRNQATLECSFKTEHIYMWVYCFQNYFGCVFCVATGFFFVLSFSSHRALHSVGLVYFVVCV